MPDEEKDVQIVTPVVEPGNVVQAQVPIDGLRIVETKLEGGKLIITVESDSVSKLIEGEARKLAYEERLRHGMARAGIESLGGTYVPAEEHERAKKQGRDVALWRIDFRITPMI